MEIVGRRIRVHGRVQGVGFRQFTVSVANQLHIEGTVRNLPDGTVECYAKGEKENMQKFLEFLKKGPPLAKVTDIQIEEVSPTLIPSHFRVIY